MTRDAVTTLVVDLGKAQIDAMLRRQDQYAIDDSEFIPLMEVVLDAFEAAGVEPSVVEELWQYAYTAYDRACREHAPDFTFDENKELMQSHLLGSRKLAPPKKRTQR